MSHVIRIDRDVARRLAEQAKPGESPNAVIRRVYLGMKPNQTRRSPIRKATSS